MQHSNPFLWLILTIIDLYIWALFISVILVNAIGALVAGFSFPALFDLTQNYGLLFAVAGVAMGLGAILSMPRHGCPHLT